MSSLVGQRLGHYEVLSLLGRGGMATVYRARQLSMGREVAVKVIDPRLEDPDDLTARFERESRIVASLSHPHIIKVFDYGEQNELLYLVMELLQGGSLAALIGQGPLSTDTTSRVLDQIASALDYAHNQDVVHRDLKPQNVLLDSQNNIQITDFGLAKLLDEKTSLSQSGGARGTPAYMSPEQWMGEPIDRRTDLYCLGVMLFEMLTGRLPFNAQTPYAVMQMHVSQPPPSISALREDLPYSLEGVMLRALAKDPADRFPSAGRLAADFKAAVDGRTSPSTVQFPTALTGRSAASPGAPTSVGKPTQPLRPRRRRAFLVFGAAISLLVLLGISLYALAGGPGKPTPTAATTATSGADATPTQLPAVLVSSLKTATGSAIAVSPSTTPLPTLTPNLQTLAAQTIAARPTLTANAIGSFTPTSTPDDAQTLSAMVNATDTAAAVASFTRTFTPTPTMTTTDLPCRVYVSGQSDQQQANVRSGPGTMYPIYQTLTPKDGKFEVTGQFVDNDNNRWWQIQYTEKTLGYVSDAFVTSEGVCDNVPKVTAPPPPPRAGTNTPTPASNGGNGGNPSSGGSSGGSGGNVHNTPAPQPQPTLPISITLPPIGVGGAPSG